MNWQAINDIAQVHFWKISCVYRIFWRQKSWMLPFSMFSNAWAQRSNNPTMGNGYTVGVCNGYVTRNSAVSRHGVSFVNNHQKLMLIPIVVTNFLQDAVI